jgi:TctA family transporter
MHCQTKNESPGGTFVAGQSMLMSQGSLKIFVGNGLVTTLVAAGFALLLVPPLLRGLGRLRRRIA